MKKNLHFTGLIGLILIIVFLAGFSLSWIITPKFENNQLYLIVSVISVTLIGAGYTLNNFIQSYILGIRQLAEETKVIIAANPTHRVQIETPSDIKNLGDTINSFADRFQAVLEDQDEQIEQAQVELEAEKNRLAALMSELAEGVLVCNIEGRILLYNNRARQLLRHTKRGEWTDNVGGYVGLGRSVFGLIDRNTITHVLEDLVERRKKDSNNLASQVVTTATNGQLIRTRTATILNQEREINGFVITLEDVTRQTQTSHQRDMLLQALTEGVRSSLANIRTAIEAIEHYPEMDTIKLGQMRRVIYDESLALSSRLNQITAEYDAYLKSDWQLEEMMGSDLLWAIQRQFEDKLKVTTTIADQDEGLWIKVDSYSVVQAIAFMMRRLKTEFGIDTAHLYLKKIGQLAALDLAWENGKVDLDTIWAWQNEPLVNDEVGSYTLRDVAEYHGGEVWCQTDRQTGITYLRLLFSTAQPKPALAPYTGPENRPEYYDFDLFHQPGQNPELDQRPLSDLSYTVFDTETTGLNPAGGDEIISISAVRIVNGRLLRHEIFDQLVDPKRSLPKIATEITGISPTMLNNQPTIEQVLPPFYKFTEGTVLLAHNAAFDMRLLQVKEAQTGIKFANPVLDTLLLSAVTHANHKDHGLDAIAQRMGVNVIGRHSSLGDAMLTGEIYLKLIPLLAERGIYTLAQARTAAKESYLARIKY